MAECKGMPEYDEGLIRHIFLNQIRNIKRKFGREYGEMILCYDSRVPSWRKTVFKEYKACRKKSREDSKMDWNKLFAFLSELKQEVDQYFPYRTISIDTAEADDIIACICHLYPNENNIIVSNDKDFYQLHRYPSTSQYSIYHKAIVKCENPERYLFEHTLRGDKGDGVPNYLSDGDTFVSKKRQRPITDKHIQEMWDQRNKNANWQSCLTQTQIENYTRNDILINLDNIPNYLKNEVKDEMEKPNNRNAANIHKYLASKGMNLMLDYVTDF